MKNSLNMLLAIIAIAAAPQAMAQSAPRAVVQDAARSAPQRELSRAEVQADLALWKRAGVADFWNRELTPDIYSSEYRAAYAEYLRLRYGPAYQEELQRLQ
ncbi:hypothetical protein A6B37_19240 [Achromobacter sp. HZ01]|jgi:hypothetical protein|uniref:DUF4148 domain-containing protein n=1 Tax=Achromobacter sp. HZ01 TaxID=1416886 RepID=UPI000DC4D150|nr:DUF4148 domain-containing protein [Achromobacter sp. HZ01]MBO9328434.1 DUF4148 domain-containing protein [Achromobacter xylosoxidans]RAP62281.1 hypothetical protein A6B37_19240 [Achromobacter sp. HZ01]